MGLKKILVVGIIFLFIGVALAPSFNLSIVKASNDNDLVEVTTQACGIKGYDNTTVKLTKQQYQNLEQYLVDFRERLKQTSTREEAVPIFKEAVVELNKYGLLPKGMSVEQVEKIVMRGCQNNNKINNLLESNKLGKQLIKNNLSNYLCLLVGKLDQTKGFADFGIINFVNFGLTFLGFVFLLSLILSLTKLLPKSIIDWFNNNYNNNKQFQQFFDNLFLFFMANTFFKWRFFLAPFEVGGNLILGSTFADKFPIGGWISTIGLNGKQFWNGSFIGDLRVISLPTAMFEWDDFFLGVSCFSGIILRRVSPLPPENFSQTVFLLGSALGAKIQYT